MGKAGRTPGPLNQTKQKTSSRKPGRSGKPTRQNAIHVSAEVHFVNSVLSNPALQQKHPGIKTQYDRLVQVEKRTHDDAIRIIAHTLKKHNEI